MKVRLIVDIGSDAVSGETALQYLRYDGIGVVQAALTRKIYEGKSDISPEGLEAILNVAWRVTYIVPEAQQDSPKTETEPA